MKVNVYPHESTFITAIFSPSGRQYLLPLPGCALPDPPPLITKAQCWPMLLIQWIGRRDIVCAHAIGLN